MHILILSIIGKTYYSKSTMLMSNEISLMIILCFLLCLQKILQWKMLDHGLEEQDLEEEGDIGGEESGGDKHS